MRPLIAAFTAFVGVVDKGNITVSGGLVPPF